MAATDWWERLYRGSDVTRLPWYHPGLDPDIDAALTARKLKHIRVLDLGTGPATQAMALAKRGHEVVATDIAPSAIEKARKAAKRRGLAIDFRVDNILDSALEEGLVDLVVDRGVFHVLPPEARPRYVHEVHRILRPRGLLFLKTFSDKEPGSYGPYRLSPGELRSHFLDEFDLESLEDATFQGPEGSAPKALFAVFRRR